METRALISIRPDALVPRALFASAQSYTAGMGAEDSQAALADLNAFAAVKSGSISSMTLSARSPDVTPKRRV